MFGKNLVDTRLELSNESSKAGTLCSEDGLNLKKKLHVQGKMPNFISLVWVERIVKQSNNVTPL